MSRDGRRSEFPNETLIRLFTGKICTTKTSSDFFFPHSLLTFSSKDTMFSIEVPNQFYFVFSLAFVVAILALLFKSRSSKTEISQKNPQVYQIPQNDGEFWFWLQEKRERQRFLAIKLARSSLSSIPSRPTPSATSTFFPLPAPNHSLNPSNLDDHKARDHLYANKCLRSPYFQTMAHQPMKSEDWIELDGNYRRDLEFKKQVIEVQVSD